MNDDELPLFGWKRPEIKPIKPIEEHRLHRRDDPKTSLETAKIARKATWPAIWGTWGVMHDGRPRTDFEIRLEARGSSRRDGLFTEDAIRHARKALEEAGRLVPTGVTRARPDSKAPCQEWVKNPDWKEEVENADRS